ncbi:DUF58 domain-containing protein [Sandaracinus amylolyticus]|uniref:Uncharacterized protein n=1 Tax=Sandaracinus amylolyticus TaxID=927083 RepID=A0A0F6YHJ2_9BACT|nr:DUF58 domain-containing protein [Sandaracinus amylolyticus]AKF04097.1 Hypothetical protein DB32_001246 [Sandaracinus amylolyticus]
MSAARTHPLISMATVAFHLAGTFALPIVVGLVAALFLEVSQVAETAPTLLLFTVVFLFPVFLMQLVGIVRKTRIEVAQLRAERRERGEPIALGFERWMEVLARHAAVITPRGYSLLFAGLVFLVAALGFQWGDLGLVATMGLLLFYGVVGVTSFLSAFLVRGFAREAERRRANVRREMSPAVVLSGEPGEERFHLIGVPVPPGYHLLVEDVLPDELGTETRHVIGAGVRTQEAIVSGKLRRSPRGLYRLGPATIGYQDVLGLTRVSVAAVASCELKVLPRFRPLEIVEPPRSKHQSPDVVVRPHRFPQEDFFRFREYARGDDTRRIHWKLSVRAGRLTLRMPESREQSVRTVVLVLDAFLPGRGTGDDAVGLADVLDALVETWVSLAAELVDRGDAVTLVAAVDDGRGGLRIESVSGRAPRTRWQDLGARARWQDRFDLPALLESVGPATDGVAVSARFDAPPPLPFQGQRFTWIYRKPEEALGPPEPGFWTVYLGGAGLGTRLLAMIRLPFPVGSDENTLGARWRRYRYERARYDARQRLRARVRRGAQSVVAALIARGDAVYTLEPGPVAHRLVGVSAGRGGVM